MDQPLSVLLSSQSNDWYTPPQYVEVARRVMGGFDLDPASCETANHWIKAERYYSLVEKGEDALTLPWAGRVWLNPPFNQSEKFTRKLIKDYQAGGVTEAIALLKFVPSYNWFAPLKTFPMVVTDHRVSFWVAYDSPGDGSLDTAVCFVYFGPESNRFLFEYTFGPFGHSVTFKNIDHKRIVCPMCNNFFDQKDWGGSDRRYCNPACRQKAYRQRLTPSITRV